MPDSDTFHVIALSAFDGLKMNIEEADRMQDRSRRLYATPDTFKARRAARLRRKFDLAMQKPGESAPTQSTGRKFAIAPVAALVLVGLVVAALTIGLLHWFSD